MNSVNSQRLLTCFAVAAAMAGTATAHATVTPLDTFGQWYEFNVSQDLSNAAGTEWVDYADGTPLAFTFTITAATELRVVDGGLAGDRFLVEVFKQSAPSISYGTSSVAPAAYSAASPSVFNDFDAAWADASYSRGSWLLTPGVYSVTGALLQSVSYPAGAPFFGAPLNSTTGGLMLLAAVPEPGTWALLLAGLGVLGVAARRRA